MPTYEYQCAKGHRFEAFQRISDKPKSKCPECGAAAKRVISGGAGLIFKGSGFYITDYGKDGKGPRQGGSEGSEAAPKAEKSDATPAGSGDSTSKGAAGKSDAKPDAKPAKKATKKAAE